MLYTHDRRPVHPKGSTLPDGANGWTQCALGAAYAIWLRAEDQPRAKADLARIVEQVSAIHTKAVAVAELEKLGRMVFVGERLKDLKLSLINHSYAKIWPLIEV